MTLLKKCGDAFVAFFKAPLHDRGKKERGMTLYGKKRRDNALRRMSNDIIGRWRAEVLLDSVCRRFAIL